MRTFTSLSVFLTASALFVAGSLLVAPKSVSADGILESIPDKTVQELSTLSFVATSTAVEQLLEFSLGVGYPVGATIDNNGLFSWIPTEEQGPGSYVITVIASELVDDVLTELGTSTFSVIVSELDNTAPSTSITSPDADSDIIDYSITISGNTIDEDGVVASTTIRFAPYLSDEGNYCGEYTDIATLINLEGTSVFNWSYDWTPPTDGVYCLTAYGVDTNGNNENGVNQYRRETENISFTRRIDPEPTLPTPEPPTPPSRSGGRRHSTSGGEVLGASTSTTPEAPQVVINTIQIETTGTVDIVWNTNVPATSQVIYGSTANGPYRLGPDKVNFGYTSATAEDSTLVMGHKVSLQNIVVGRSYSLRVLSRTSTPTFGPEYRFTLGADGNVKFEGEYGNEIIMGGSINKIPTLFDFVKENQDKINLLFGN